MFMISLTASDDRTILNRRPYRATVRYVDIKIASGMRISLNTVMIISVRDAEIVQREMVPLDLLISTSGVVYLGLAATLDLVFFD